MSGTLQSGKIMLVLAESPTSAGSQTRIFTIDSDTVQTSLFVTSIAGGSSLSISVRTLTDTGMEKEVITYPNVTAASTELDLKKAATAMGIIKVVAIYTGACSFELRAKGLSSGETSAKIQSASIGKASQLSVDSTAVVLVMAAMSDRNGIIVKNNSTNTYILYLGFSAAEATAGTGYPLGKQEALGIDIGAGAVLWGISGSGTIDVRIIEAGG